MDFLTFAKHCHERSDTPRPGLRPLSVGDAVEDRVPVGTVQALEERGGRVVAGEREGEIFRHGEAQVTRRTLTAEELAAIEAAVAAAPVASNGPSRDGDAHSDGEITAA